MLTVLIQTTCGLTDVAKVSGKFCDCCQTLIQFLLCLYSHWACVNLCMRGQVAASDQDLLGALMFSCGNTARTDACAREVARGWDMS